MLKQELSQTLESTGISGKLKAQLRASLVHELGIQLKRQLLNEPGSTHLPHALLVRLLDTLILDYLKFREFDFTLSVFLPESGLFQNTLIMSKSEMEQLLRFDQESNFVRLWRQEKEKFNIPGKLIHVDQLDILAMMHALYSTVQTSQSHQECQTNRFIDNLGIPSLGSDNPSKLLEFEERMFQYQRQVHLQAQKEIEEKLEQFKQLEIAKAKLEEEQKYQSTLKTMQLQYETQTALIQRQQLQELQRQDEVNKKRHEEFEEQLATAIRNTQEDYQRQLSQEITARQKKELQNEQLSLSLLEMERQVREAEEKLAHVRNISQKFDFMVEQEVEKFKKSFMEEQSNSLRRLKEDERLVAEEKKRLDDYKTASQHQLAELKAAILSSQAELRDDSSKKAMEFEIMSLKMKLKEYETLEANRRQDPPKHEEIQKLKKSEQLWRKECQDLVKKLDHEMNRNEELKKAYQHLVFKNKELMSEVADLRLLMHEARMAQSVSKTVERAQLFREKRDYRPLPDPLSSIEHSKSFEESLLDLSFKVEPLTLYESVKKETKPVQSLEEKNVEKLEETTVTAEVKSTTISAMKPEVKEVPKISPEPSIQSSSKDIFEDYRHSRDIFIPPMIHQEDSLSHESIDTKESIVDTKESIVDTKEPIIDTKEPIIDTKEPIIDTKESIIDTKEPIKDKLEEIAQNPVMKKYLDLVSSPARDIQSQPIVAGDTDEESIPSFDGSHGW